MRRSLPLIFSVLVAICAVGMTIDQGQALPIVRCRRTGCSESPAPPKPADPPPTQSINIAPLPLPIPDLGGCHPRAHSQATIKFQAKIAGGRESILQGISDGISNYLNLLNACNNLIFRPAQLSCITKLCNDFETLVENEAAKKCKEDVERKAREDTECQHRQVGRLHVIARITENIRVQCCSSLAPQGKADLLAYCDYAAKQVRDKLCPVTPAVDTPVPSQTLDEPLE
jgi:hypothetical protein